jgi:6,7-dimethyl-8-ribityllumazine synthase
MRGCFFKTYMSSTHKNLSKFEGSEVPGAARYKFGIVWSEWNHEITNELKVGALGYLRNKEAKEKNIIIKAVPGAFELTLGAQYLLEKQRVDAVIVLGCVIQGETRHFDFICEAVANGVTQLNIKYGKPVIFGLLTPDTMQQAIDRAGGKHGNKGEEAAATAIKMLALRDSFTKK